MLSIPGLQGQPGVHSETAKTLKNIYNHTTWSNLKITRLKTKQTNKRSIHVMYDSTYIKF